MSAHKDNTLWNMSLDPQYRPVTPLDCHKRLEKNQLIHFTREISEGSFELVSKPDYSGEDFFFDHDIDHVPGMLTACAQRQASLVICHHHLGITNDGKFKFILLDQDSSFTKPICTSSHFRIHCELFDPKYCRETRVLRSARFLFRYFQDGRVC